MGGAWKGKGKGKEAEGGGGRGAWRGKAGKGGLEANVEIAGKGIMIILDLKALRCMAVTRIRDGKGIIQ
jgi:hypothetical protein